MEGQSALSELSVISWVSAVEGCLLIKRVSTVSQTPLENCEIAGLEWFCTLSLITDEDVLSQGLIRDGGGGGGGCGEREARGEEMLPTLVVCWRASALRGKEAGRFRKVAGVSIVAAGGPHSR